MTSKDIKVGDRVRLSVPRRGWLVGDVEELDDGIASVRISARTRIFLGVGLLTRLDATRLVRSGAAQPPDDQAREDAIAALRVPSVIEAVTDDYLFAIGQAGDLGGTEL